MNIRSATLQDATAIAELQRDAFGPAEGPVVAKLAVDLLTNVMTESASVFLALKDGPTDGSCDVHRTVGCIIFSDVRISDHKNIRGAILAPLAVATSQQRTGIGSALVKHGLDAMKNQCVDLVLVYGDPRYYTKFGFGFQHHISAPYPLQYPEAWMALELTPRVLTLTSGTAICVSSLQNPAYW